MGVDVDDGGFGRHSGVGKLPNSKGDLREDWTRGRGQERLDAGMKVYLISEWLSHSNYLLLENYFTFC